MVDRSYIRVRASDGEMFNVYLKQIRSLKEMADPVWEPGLTKQEAKQIERVQKNALYVIFGER